MMGNTTPDDGTACLLDAADDALPAAVLARVQAEYEAQRRSVRRWARQKDQQLQAAAARDLKRLRRAAAESRLVTERARHVSPDTDPVAFALEHFDDRIVAMETAGLALDLRRLARWTPWREWLAWYADPVNAAVFAAYRAHERRVMFMFTDPREAARSSETRWAVSDKVQFAGGIRLPFLDNWALVMATHRPDLRRLVKQRWSPKRQRYIWRRPIKTWPWPIRVAALEVAAELNAANARHPFYTLSDLDPDMPNPSRPATITAQDVISRALVTPFTLPTAHESQEQLSCKQEQRIKAERILGDRCVDCGRTRADGWPLQLDEVDGRGGGRLRGAAHRTYGLRNEVIAYAETHDGKATPRILLRCQPCHGHRHRLAYLARRAGLRDRCAVSHPPLPFSSFSNVP